MTTWFRFWKKDSVQEGAAAAPTHNLKVQKSLALNVLYHHFREDRKYRILDLGPAVGQNIEFFSQFPCKLFIEDLYGTLSSFDFVSPEDGFSYEAVFSYLLPFSRNSSFDVILAWDILNYLDRDVLQHLLRHLGRFSRSGTVLFSLIATGKYIPDTPHRFRILDPETLQYECDSTVQRPCPRYETSDLTHFMPSFRVTNSFVLRNGYREYIFSFE
jgi:hypothetical protein